MIKIYVAILFLCSIHITNNSNIEVEFDESKDVIIKDGKMYMPVGGSHTEQEQNTYPRNLAHEEEEHATGAAFWIYIIMILRTIDYKSSYHLLRRSDVGINCWLSLNR